MSLDMKFIYHLVDTGIDYKSYILVESSDRGEKKNLGIPFLFFPSQGHTHWITLIENSGQH